MNIYLTNTEITRTNRELSQKGKDVFFVRKLDYALENEKGIRLVKCELRELQEDESLCLCCYNVVKSRDFCDEVCMTEYNDFRIASFEQD